MWELHGSFGPESPQDDKEVREDSSGLKPDRNDKTFERRLIQVDVPSAESLQRTAKSPEPPAVQQLLIAHLQIGRAERCRRSR
jgi:hypothetical protein